jgi:hypothetical protein
MSSHRDDLLSLHPVSVVGSFLGGARPHQPYAAPRDAEPEDAERRESPARRLAGAFRIRREAPARAQAGRV